MDQDRRDIAQQMRGITKQMRGRIARLGTSAGASLIAANIRRRLRTMDDQESPNKIWRNVATQHSRRYNQRTGNVMYRVGIRGGAKTAAENALNPGGDTFYWRFLEFGTKNMPPRPFMRPAMEESMGQLYARMYERMQKEFDKL